MWPGTHRHRSFFHSDVFQMVKVRSLHQRDPVLMWRWTQCAQLSWWCEYAVSKPVVVNQYAMPGDAIIFDGLLAHRGTSNDAFSRPRPLPAAILSPASVAQEAGEHRQVCAACAQATDPDALICCDGPGCRNTFHSTTCLWPPLEPRDMQSRDIMFLGTVFHSGVPGCGCMPKCAHGRFICFCALCFCRAMLLFSCRDACFLQCPFP